MTSKRDLGPVLGLAGAAAIIVAVVAGFIVVGGPGDARAERFDQMTMERINTIAHAAHCVMTVSGVAPPDREALLDRVSGGPLPVDTCEYIDVTQIQASDEVEYAALGASTIRLCAVFRTSFEMGGAANGFEVARYPELEVSRPSGRHCYDLRLRPLPASNVVIYPPEESAEPVEAPPLQ